MPPQKSSIVKNGCTSFFRVRISPAINPKIRGMTKMLIICAMDSAGRAIVSNLSFGISSEFLTNVPSKLPAKVPSNMLPNEGNKLSSSDVLSVCVLPVLSMYGTFTGIY
jgi:hypothetical protein